MSPPSAAWLRGVARQLMSLVRASAVTQLHWWQKGRSLATRAGHKRVCVCLLHCRLTLLSRPPICHPKPPSLPLLWWHNSLYKWWLWKQSVTVAALWWWHIKRLDYQLAAWNFLAASVKWVSGDLIDWLKMSQVLLNRGTAVYLPVSWEAIIFQSIKIWRYIYDAYALTNISFVWYDPHAQ